MIHVPLKYFLIAPYPSVLRYQESLFEKALSLKESHQPVSPCLIICQHYPVYTLGNKGRREHLLIQPENIGADYIEVNRGGDITFHGPGQMVVYPIWDLDQLKIGVAQYVFNLEECAIQTLKDFNIVAHRIEGEPGVWVQEEKIAAIGIKVSRQVTMHGMALNVNTDLAYFDHIIPCGIADKKVTSMAKIFGRSLNMIDVVNVFKKCFEKVFKVVVK
jgi:lipoyl(octanoyl) transferase